MRIILLFQIGFILKNVSYFFKNNLEDVKYEIKNNCFQFIKEIFFQENYFKTGVLLHNIIVLLREYYYTARTLLFLLKN